MRAVLFFGVGGPRGRAPRFGEDAQREPDRVRQGARRCHLARGADPEGKVTLAKLLEDGDRSDRADGAESWPAGFVSDFSATCTFDPSVRDAVTGLRCARWSTQALAMRRNRKLEAGSRGLLADTGGQLKSKGRTVGWIGRDDSTAAHRRCVGRAGEVPGRQDQVRVQEGHRPAQVRAAGRDARQACRPQHQRLHRPPAAAEPAPCLRHPAGDDSGPGALPRLGRPAPAKGLVRFAPSIGPGARRHRLGAQRDACERPAALVRGA